MPTKQRVPQPRLLEHLQRHFGADPATLAVVEQPFEMYERPNLHLAVEECLAEAGRQATLLGVLTDEDYHSVRLAKLTRPATAIQFDEGPVQYIDHPLPGGKQLACVKRGLYPLHDRGSPVAMLLTVDRFAQRGGVVVEVMARERDLAQDFLRKLTARTRFAQAFRGHVLSLEQDCFGNLTIHYHSLPAIRRDDIILPETLLRRVERHTLGFTRHAAALTRAGRHLKRGLLLRGLPGTGKTLTAMYLAAQMTGRTVLLLTGRGINSIETACSLARCLEPVTLILEDVDLIGTERERQTMTANALLYELLNQMDGLAQDADILFVLTTNRPEILEPALAARPGRIDQAIEIPLPDADCRRRLFALYSRGLEVAVKKPEALLARLEGASGAFIRELLRKAALLAAESDGKAPLTVRGEHLDEAMKELVVAGGPLTQSLLGARVDVGGKRKRSRRR